MFQNDKSYTKNNIGIVFLFIGITHLIKTSEMAVYVLVLSGSVLFVYFIGTIIVFASLGVIVNKYLLTSLITLSITMAFSVLLVQILIIVLKREYILKVIELSNLIKLGLATALLLMVVYYKQKFVSHKQ